MSVNFGGGSATKRERGSSSQRIELPAPTAEQTELTRLQMELAQLQKGEIEGASKDRAAFEASPLAAQQREIEEKATANLLARINGTAPVLSPEQSQYLDTIYGTALQRGEADLMRFGQQAAASRGMAVTDSPIGGDLLRQRREFGEGLESSRAKSALDLGSAGEAFNANLAQFREQLRQQAFQNRLALGGLNPGFSPFAAGLSNERLAQASRFGTQRGTSLFDGFNYGGKVSYADVAGFGGGKPGGGGGGFSGV